MSTTSILVRNGIESAIRAITPAVDVSWTFKVMSDDGIPLDEGALPSGAERTFEVIASDAIVGDLHHSTECEVIQTFRVVVVYPSTSDARKLAEMVQSDRHQIKVAVDSPSNWPDGVIFQFLRSWDAPQLGDDYVLLSLGIEVRFLESTTT